MTRAIVEQDYTNIAQDLLARAAKHGATASDVMVADGETLSVQVRMGAVDRLTKAREKRLGLRVFFGQRSASASTSDFSRESLERFVGETCALAQAVVEDPVSGLPEPGQFATDFPELNIHDSTKLQTDQQIDLALRAERAGVKFNDADLIGAPYHLVIGEKGLAQGQVELKLRHTGETQKVAPDQVVSLLSSFLKAAS